MQIGGKLIMVGGCMPNYSVNAYKHEISEGNQLLPEDLDPGSLCPGFSQKIVLLNGHQAGKLGLGTIIWSQWPQTHLAMFCISERVNKTRISLF